MISIKKVSRGGGIFVALTLIFFSTSYSQSYKDLKNDDINSISNKLAVQLPEQPLLDNVVNPAEYVVGPGDILLLNILGELNYSFQIVVTPEGTAILPTVGPVPVSGITLQQAKEKITAKVLTHYRGVDVTVTLIGLRQFLVSVVGEVKAPGIYKAQASQRGVDLILAAGGITANGSKRQIQVKRRDGSIKWVDLEKFQRAGDYKRNPYLLEGDVIFVPARQNDIGIIGIYGAVRSPGEFEYCPGDSLFDLIDLGQGLRDDALLEEAELVRFDAQTKLAQTIPLNLAHLYAANPGPQNMALHSEDRVFVKFKPNPYAKAEATILGKVMAPGSYAIQEDKTKLTDLVNLAGGFTSAASLVEAEMFRTSFANLPDSAFLKLIQASPNNLRPDEFEYLKNAQKGAPGKVSVDFVKLFDKNDTSQDRLLRDGDSIYIPAPSLIVNLAGQVVRPGLVPYVEGLSAGEYVSRAGGFSGKADKGKIYLVKRGSGEWTRLGGKQKIEPGDTIWVPMRGDKSFWGTFKDVVLTVGSIATTYFVIDQASK